MGWSEAGTGEATRSWSRRAFLGALGAAAAVPLAPGSSAAAVRRPNVLFIAVDDLNAWVGALGGHPQTRTPSIDQLARSGVLFERAYCSVPYCLASRVALLTGIEPYRSGVYRLHDWREHLPMARTIPKHFREHGYETFGVGKVYHEQGAKSIQAMDPHAWDAFHRAQNRFPERDGDGNRGFKMLGRTPDPMDWGAIDAPDEMWADYQIAERIGAYVGQAHERPFFAACGFFSTHLPWFVPSKYFRPFPLGEIQLPAVKDDDLADVPAIGRDWAKNPSRYPIFAHWLSGAFLSTFGRGYDASMRRSGQRASAVQAYLAAVHFLDAMVGAVLAALWSGPNAGDTVVVLWSDHGGHMGEKLAWTKFTLWEEATRVPFIVYVPPTAQPALGMARAAGRCAAPVSLIDTFATLIEVCGLPPVDGIQSTSLVRQLRDPGSSPERPAITTWLRGNHSVRLGAYRYTLYRDGGEELYDHSSDPMEWNNLSRDPRTRVVKADLRRFIPQDIA